jgi:hypothetical protein
MKKLLLCITIILCVCTYGWTAGVPFTGSIDAEDVDYPNTKSISGNPTNVKTAIDGLKTEINSISSVGLADIDDLPGDTVDDNKIDSALINLATSTVLGVAKFSNTQFNVGEDGLVTAKSNVFQPYDAGLTPWGSVSSTAPVFTGSSIQSGVAGSQQGGLVLWSNTHAVYGFTLLPGTISESVTFRSPGAMPAGDNYLLNIDASTGQMDYTNPADFAAADHVHTGTYEPADANILKTTTTLGTFSGSTIADNQTLAQALQALETAVEASVTSAKITDNTITAADIAATLTFADGDFLDLSGITMSADTDEGFVLPAWANVTPHTTTKAFAAWDSSAKAIKVYTADGWVTAGGGTGTGAPTDSAYMVIGSADANLSAERRLAIGAGLSGTDAGANSTYTIAADLGTLVNSQTIFDGSQASRTITFNLSGTDPVLTLGSSVFNVSTGTLQQGGVNAIIGALGSTDNAILRADGTGAQTAQGSLVTIDDTGSINIPAGQTYKINGTALAVGNITGAAPLADPTFTGTVTLPSPFTVGSTSVTTTGAQLNYLSAATGTTGTTSSNLVYSTSPTLVTPNIGAASATSINKVAITAPATSSTLTIADGKTFTASNTITLTGTDGATLAIGGGGTLGTAAYTAATAYQGADTTLTNLGGLTIVQGNIIYGTGSDTVGVLAKDTNATRYLSNTGTNNNPAWAQINLANGVTGNLPVTNLNSGISAGPTTFWRGDGTWATPAGGGDLKADGTVPLTANWNMGEYTITAAGFNTSKASGTAGANGLYEANGTDTSVIGWMGPASIAESWYYQFSSTQPTAGQVMAFAAPTGTGGPGGSKTSAQTWVIPALSASYANQVTLNAITSGGIAYGSASNTISSTGALTQYGVLIGGGAGNGPSALAVGSNNQVLRGSTGAAPSFGALVAADLPLVPASKGGTGVANNDANTITFAGGNYGLTLTLAGATNVTLPTSGTLLAANGALGTPASGTLTNCTGLPVAGIAASTSTALGVGSVELGHATDTTLSRSSAGVLAVEGTTVSMNSTTATHTAGTIELGAASDTTIARTSAGIITVEGVTISRTIASGTVALGTSAIASGSKASTVTVAATGVATTDTIEWAFNADPTAVTGYTPSANGMLTIICYPTTNNVNFVVCNNTGASITPGAITLNWRVSR